MTINTQSYEICGNTQSRLISRHGGIRPVVGVKVTMQQTIRDGRTEVAVVLSIHELDD
jgi:hypothetical protein